MLCFPIEILRFRITMQRDRSHDESWKSLKFSGKMREICSKQRTMRCMASPNNAYIYIFPMNFNDSTCRRSDSLKVFMRATVHQTIVFVRFGAYRQMDVWTYFTKKVREIIDPTFLKPVFFLIRRFGK